MTSRLVLSDATRDVISLFETISGVVRTASTRPLSLTSAVEKLRVAAAPRSILGEPIRLGKNRYGDGRSVLALDCDHRRGLLHVRFVRYAPDVWVLQRAERNNCLVDVLFGLPWRQAVPSNLTRHNAVCTMCDGLHRLRSYRARRHDTHPECSP